jgi:hypothetical protein
VDNDHGRDVDDGEVVRNAESGGIHMGGKCRDVGVEEISYALDVEQPDRCGCPRKFIAQGTECDQSKYSGG